MNFNEYQARARETAIYPNLGGNLSYPALGLGGEAGEAAEKVLAIVIDTLGMCAKAGRVQEHVKKTYRDDNGIITPARRQELCKELGDQLWYLANTATEADLTLEDVAQANLSKLHQRLDNDTLRGSGDNR